MYLQQRDVSRCSPVSCWTAGHDTSDVQMTVFYYSTPSVNQNTLYM